MSAIDGFLTVAQAYQDASGLKTQTLSWRLFEDSKKLAALRAGADMQVTRWEKALQYLSDTWPADAVWPSDVPRPPPIEAAPTDQPPRRASQAAPETGAAA